MTDQPYGPGFQLDPYPVLTRLRESQPLSRMTHPTLGECHLALRYAHVRSLVADPRLVKPLEEGDENSLNSAPPTHTRLRKLVQQGFTQHRLVEAWPRMQRVVSDLLDSFAGREVVEMVSEYANPMPMAVINMMLGVPEADRPHVIEVATSFLDGEDEERRAKAYQQAHGYVVELVAAKRRRPGDDVVSDLIAAREGEDRLSEDELVRLVMTLLVNGVITTTNVIGTGLDLLLRHPDQLAMLRGEPDRMEAAVEEMLRFEPPVSAVVWTATEPIDLGDARIGTGEHVVTSFQGANRDPRQFDDPDRFDATRDPNPHLSFSHGIHHCLGAVLARMELIAAFQGLLERYPVLEPAGEPRWRDSYVVRGLAELSLRVGGAPR
ncbi:cytochrome P450 [Nonomuraea sp. NPDC049158]|uniref:cytochrome P450 family protein n=1 Tax=Nonomuraea sp. NPDC049158 TaxID=3155649 RepID=UPI0033F310DB